MLVLIFALAVGLGITYFATQNTSQVTLHFTTYTFTHVPLYFLIVGSLLAGLIIAGIFSLINTLSTTFTILGKDKSIKDKKLTIAELTKHNHQLELENERLKTELGGSTDQKSL